MPELANITLLICDVDGVMTSGQIIYDATGNETKVFNVRDGSGLKYWQRVGHQAAILSGRKSVAVTRRAEELGIRIVEQGAKDKVPALERILDAASCTGGQAAYIGDDLPDLPAMSRVAFCVAVADAAAEVLDAADLVTQAHGGCGAVRETVEFILKAQGRWATIMDRYRPDTDRR